MRDIIRMELPNVDVDGDGNAENGVFEFRNYRLEQRIRSGFLVGGGGSQVRQTIQDKIAETNGISQYKDFFVNEGTGERVIAMQFRAAAGDTADTVTWGDPNESQGTIANATDQGPFERMQVLEHYLAALSEDSRNPITLRFGGYDSGDLFDSGDLNTDSLNVVLENPTLTYEPREEPSGFSGELTFLEAVADDAVISAIEGLGRDIT